MGLGFPSRTQEQALSGFQNPERACFRKQISLIPPQARARLALSEERLLSALANDA